MSTSPGGTVGFINLADKTINAKLVYYGVGLGGKTTSLKVVHNIMCPRDEVKLVSINTEQDSTLLFDFLPIDLGQIEGFKIRVQGFTVPGQPKYVVMRRYVLQSADAVVLVVDSQRKLIEENYRAIEDLKQNLEVNGLDWRTIPLVIQYNKRDLPDTVPDDKLDELFKFREVPTYRTIATEQEGVFEAFVDVVGTMVEEKVHQYGLGKGSVDPQSIATEARQKLVQIQEITNADDPAAHQGLVSVSVDEGATAPPTVVEPSALTGVEPSKVGPKTARFSATPSRPSEATTPGQAQSGEPTIEAGEAVPESIEEEVAEHATGLLGQAISSNLELAELYSELAEYKSLLEKKNRELVEVNQLISHDLKKPLTVFKTVITLMQKGALGELSDRQRDAIQNCAESVRYMEELISDILESSRLDYDGVSFDFADVDMTQLVGTIVRRLRYHLEDAGVRIRVDPLPVILGDGSALQKVFMNLIGNAINYRDPDKSQPMIRVLTQESDTDWFFRIADNGIGIPQESLEAIWQKFARGDNTGGISGTGLGLYIVQQTIRGHGGDVRVESVVGEGTTFVIRLPKAPVQPEHSPVA